MAVCAGSVSLPAEERAELLAVLAADADEALAERAAGVLLTQTAETLCAALQRAETTPQIFQFCARHLVERAGIADAMALSPSCPVESLLPAVKHLSTSAVQTLMDDLDRLSSAPALAAALALSSSLTVEQRHQLQELQQETSDPAAIREAVQATDLDPAKRITLLQRLARMRVVERVQLALKGNREERLALIRDPCRIVQRAVLQSARLTDREVEAFAAMANLSEEVLRLIGTNRKFRKNYAVQISLLNNPKTPLDVSLHLLPNVTVQDLKMLILNKNIPETVRVMATRLNRQRNLARQSS